MSFHLWIFHFSYWCSIHKSPVVLFWQKSFDYHMIIFMRCWICLAIIFAEDFHICFHLEYCFVVLLYYDFLISWAGVSVHGGLTAVGRQKSQGGKAQVKEDGEPEGCTWILFLECDMIVVQDNRQNFGEEQPTPEGFPIGPGLHGQAGCTPVW